MKKTMELAGITISVVIGAGFATGREIKTYFTKNGDQSYLIIAVVTVLLWFGAILLLNKAPSMGKIIALSFTVFNFVLMMATFSSLFAQLTGLPVIAGVFLGVAMAVLGVLAGFERFTSFTGLLCPCLAVALVVMLVLCTNVTPQRTGVSPPSWFISTIKFVGFNFLSALVILPEVGKRYTTKQKLLGSAVGVLVLSACIFVVNKCFLSDYSNVLQWDMPLIQAILVKCPLFIRVMSISMLLTIIVLALCNLSVGFARMVSSGEKEKAIGLLFVILAAPFSLLGFTALMDNVYPIFGIIGFSLLLWHGGHSLGPAALKK